MSSRTDVPAQPANTAGPREAIIDVAAQRFAHQGFHGVSMRDIAKAHSSSVAALYNHFASKNELLLAIGERFFSVVTDHLRATAAGPGDGLTRVLSMVQVTFTDACAYRDEFLTISRDNHHVAMTPELAPLVGARNECIASWNEVLSDGMRDGSIHPGLNRSSIITILFSAIAGIFDGYRTGSGATVTQEGFSCLTELLTGGLKPR